MKRLIPIFVAIMFLGGCAATNLFEKNSDRNGYDWAKRYCKKHSTNYDECMDEEYYCAIEISSITGADYASPDELKEMGQKVIKVLKRNGIYKEWFGNDLSYCELLEVYKRDW